MLLIWFLLTFASKLPPKVRWVSIIATAFGISVPLLSVLVSIQGTPTEPENTSLAAHSATHVEQDAYRVLILGQSLTLQNNGEIERQLSDKYHGETGRSLQILDAGNIWQSVQQSSISYQENRNWEPDVVLLMVGLTDLCQWLELPEAPGPVDLRWRTLFQPYLPRSNPAHIGNRILQRLRLDIWYGSLRSQEIDIPWLSYKSIQPAVKQLRQLIHEIQQDGARVIVMTQPSLYYTAKLAPEDESILWLGRSACRRHSAGFAYQYASAQSLGRAMRLLNYEVRNTANGTGAELVDLEREIATRASFFESDVHLSRAGSQLATTLIAKHIFKE